MEMAFYLVKMKVEGMLGTFDIDIQVFFLIVGVPMTKSEGLRGRR